MKTNIVIKAWMPRALIEEFNVIRDTHSDCPKLHDLLTDLLTDWVCTQQIKQHLKEEL